MIAGVDSLKEVIIFSQNKGDIDVLIDSRKTASEHGESENYKRVEIIEGANVLKKIGQNRITYACRRICQSLERDHLFMFLFSRIFFKIFKLIFIKSIDL